MRIAERIVATLLDEGRHLPIQVRTADGQVVDCDFTGYWDLRQQGRGAQPCVGYPLGRGGFSHGFLHQGDEIITPLPSPEEWNAGEEVGSAPAKATFWASSGSGAY